LFSNPILLEAGPATTINHQVNGSRDDGLHTTLRPASQVPLFRKVTCTLSEINIPLLRATLSVNVKSASAILSVGVHWEGVSDLYDISTEDCCWPSKMAKVHEQKSAAKYSLKPIVYVYANKPHQTKTVLSAAQANVPRPLSPAHRTSTNAHKAATW
jgi:hypothetical protein